MLLVGSIAAVIGIVLLFIEDGRFLAWPLLPTGIILGTSGYVWSDRRDKAEQARQLKSAAKRASPLKPRVEAVTAAFAEATRLMAELQHDLQVQQAAHQLLAEAVDEHQKFLEVNQEQAEKI